METQKWQTGTIHWLDISSGDGMVRGGDGSLYYVHKSAFKEKPASDVDGKAVRFKLMVDLTFQQVRRIELLGEKI